MPNPRQRLEEILRDNNMPSLDTGTFMTEGDYAAIILQEGFYLVHKPSKTINKVEVSEDRWKGFGIERLYAEKENFHIELKKSDQLIYSLFYYKFIAGKFQTDGRSSFGKPDCYLPIAKKQK